MLIPGNVAGQVVQSLVVAIRTSKEGPGGGHGRRRRWHPLHDPYREAVLEAEDVGVA